MSPHHWILSVLCLATMLALFSCAKPTRPEDEEAVRQAAAEAKVIARVNGEPITLAKFQASIAELPVFLRLSVKGETAMRRYFGDMVTFTLLAQEAQTQGYGDDPDVLFATRQSLERQLRQDFETTMSVDLEPAQVERLAEGPHLTEPRVTLDLIRCLSAQRAQRLRIAYRVLLAAGPPKSPAEVFNLLARRTTEEYVASTIIGPLERRDAELTLPAEVLEAALQWTADPVPLPPAVTTDEGSFLYFIVEREAAQPMPKEEARAFVRQDLIQKERDQRWESERQRLLEAAQVEVVDESLRGATELLGQVNGKP